MGNDQDTFNIDLNNWKPLTKMADFNILINQVTRQHLQQYCLQFYDKGDFEIEIQFLNLRNQGIQNTVAIKGWRSSKTMGCSFQISLNVYTQYIPLTLQQLYDIKQQKAQYILFEALKGFHNLYSIFNCYIQIHAKLIGFNQQNAVKVWINSNYSINYPDCQRFDYNEPLEMEQNMVTKLIKTIENHILDRRFNKKFIELLQMSKPYTFSSTIQIMNNYFQINYQLHRNGVDLFSGRKLQNNKTIKSSLSNKAQIGVQRFLEKQNSLVINENENREQIKNKLKKISFKKIQRK